VSELCPSSGILKTREKNVSEAGSVIEVSSKEPNRVSPSSTEDGSSSSFRNVVFSSFFRIPDDG
jgi:hypothetical protein